MRRPSDKNFMAQFRVQEMVGPLRIEGLMVVEAPDAKTAAVEVCDDDLVDSGVPCRLRAEVWRVGTALPCQRFYMPPEDD